MVLLRNLLIFLLVISWKSIKSDGYRILAIFPLNARSHNFVFEGVMKSLANRGHQVDVITHFELKDPPKNYRTIINLSGTIENLMNSWDMDKVKIIQNSDFVSTLAIDFGNYFCELMSLEKIQKFIQNPPKDLPYDLVITEASASNCFIGFGYVFKAPVITISTTLEYPWTDETVGNPTSLAFATNFQTCMSKISTFLERLVNTFTIQYNKIRFLMLTENPQTEAMRKYLRPDIPDIREVEKSVSLLFVNYHHSIYGIKPLTPAVVPIAGIHIEHNDAKFTPELKAWMDESHHGVIYFSLGTLVLLETLPEKTLLAIYASFTKIAPVRVIMRVVNKEKLPPGLPNNVLIMPWIPQVPVLGHKNTRVFITHGGLNGLQEAIYFGVPMICFPLFGDQYLHANILLEKNLGIKMDYNNISEKSLDDGLNTLLYNPKYRENTKRISRLFRDRPMNATETVIFWVEYIMRNGANSLRSPAVDLHWWQVELIDVYGFLFTCTFIIIYIAFIILKYVIRLIVNIIKPEIKLHKKMD